MATPPTQKPKRKRTHILELDGVRGIAILIVMIYHFGESFAESQHNFLGSVLHLGWVGVDLFFVLSGFLITSILLDTKSDPRYFRNFYIRRGLRILPLYYAFLIVFAFLFLPFVHHHHKFEDYHVGQMTLYWVHLSNWSSAWGPLASSPIGQMWSLAIEEQFYFLWPLVIFLLPERYLSAVCIVFAATALGLRVLPSMQAIQATHHEFLYRLTPFRIEPLCYGALIAAVSRMKHMTRIRGWSGPICLVLGVALLGLLWVHGHSFAYYSLSMATFGYTAAGLCSSGVILLALRYQGTATGYAWLLRSSFLRTFGKYSYALYIFHSPIAQYSFKAVHHFIHNLLISSGIAFILGGGLSLLLAKLSWMYFEAPILSLKDRFAHYRREVQFPAAAEESLASSGVAAEG